MKGKKLWSFLVSGALIFSSSVTSLAQEIKPSSVASNYTLLEGEAKISKSDAASIASKVVLDYFGINVGDKKLQSNVDFRSYDELKKKYIWDMRWNGRIDDKNVDVGVSIDATYGKVIAMRRYEYVEGKETTSIYKISEEKARKACEDFLTKFAPEEFKQVKLANDDYYRLMYGGNGSNTYSFRYVRNVNGVSFSDNYISVEVSGRDGRIMSYNINWDFANEINFDRPDNIIDSKNAIELFKDTSDMSLYYLSVMDPYGYYNQLPKVKLTYNYTDNGTGVLDAKTGKFVSLNGSNVNEIKTKDLTEERRKEFLSKFKEVNNVKDTIDKDEAEKLMEDALNDMLGEECTIDSISYQDRGNGYNQSDIWTAQFYIGKSYKPYGDNWGSVTMNALNGEIISLNMFYDRSYYEEFKPKLTWDEAYDKAIDIIEKYYPGKIKYIDTKQTYIKNLIYYNGKEAQENLYVFNFPRLVNGIPYINDNISIGFDIKTGNARSIYINWSDNITFQDPKGVMSKDKAKEIFFENHEVELYYTLTGTSFDNTAKLAYRLKNKIAGDTIGRVDAFTGKILDYNGNEILNKVSNFNEKIKGNPYEQELIMMAQNRIIDGRTFDPKKDLTKLDLIKMLVNAKGYYPYLVSGEKDLLFTNNNLNEEDYGYLQLAVKYNIIKNTKTDLKLNYKITREDMAEYMVKFLGYDKIANSSGIFNIPYSDAKMVSKDKVGYVAIARGLDIVPLGNGKFNPKQVVKMDEGAHTLYLAMDKGENK